jgi:hypothetical protein
MISDKLPVLPALEEIWSFACRLKNKIDIAFPTPNPASNTVGQLEAYTAFDISGIRLRLSGAILFPSQVFVFRGPVFLDSTSQLGQSREGFVMEARFVTVPNAMDVTEQVGPDWHSDVLVAHLTAIGRTAASFRNPEFIRRRSGDHWPSG